MYGTTKKVLAGFGKEDSTSAFQRFVFARLPGRTTPGFVMGTFRMTRADKPESFCHKDFPNICSALLLALTLLAKHGDKEGVDQVTAVAEGESKLELRPE